MALKTAKTLSVEIAANETVAVNCRAVEIPFGYSVHPGVGGAVLRTASNLDRPGDEFWQPETYHEIVAARGLVERGPIAWTRFFARDAAARVDFTYEGDLTIHNQATDRLAVNDAARRKAIPAAPGSEARFAATELVGYPKGRLRLAYDDDHSGNPIFSAAIEGNDFVITRILEGIAPITIDTTITPPYGGAQAVELVVEVAA